MCLLDFYFGRLSCDLPNPSWIYVSIRDLLRFAFEGQVVKLRKMNAVLVPVDFSRRLKDIGWSQLGLTA